MSADSSIDERVEALPAQFINVIRLLQSGELVQCLHAIVEIGEKQQSSEILKIQLNKFQSENLELSNQNNLLVEQARDLEETNKRLQTLLYDAQGDSQRMQAEIFNTNAHVQELIKENQIVGNRNQDLVIQLQEFKQELIQLQKANDATLREKDQQISQLQSDLGEVQASMRSAPPQIYKGTQTTPDLEQIVQVSYGELHNVDFDQQHLIQLLLHDNYLLSNLVRQKYAEKSESYTELMDKILKKPNARLQGEIMTLLVNFKDLALNQVYVKQYIDQILRAPQVQAVSGEMQNQPGCNQMIECLQRQLQFGQVVEQQISTQHQITNRHALESLFYKSMCMYYQKLVNGSAEQLLKYDHSVKQAMKEHIQVLQQQVRNFKGVAFQTPKNQTMRQFSNTESQDNKQTLNQIIFNLNNQLQEQRVQLIEQDAKIHQLENINRLLETQQDSLSCSLKKKLDILLFNTDLSKITKLNDLIHKQNEIIKSQQKDLEVLQQEVDMVSEGVQAETLDPEKVALAEQILRYQAAMGQVISEAKALEAPDLGDVGRVANVIVRKLKGIGKVFSGVSEALSKQQALISAHKALLDAQLNKSLIIVGTQTDTAETREQQVLALIQSVNNGVQTDETALCPEKQVSWKDVQTDDIACQSCKRLVQDYIMSQNSMERIQEQYHAAVSEGKALRTQVEELQGCQRIASNLQKQNKSLINNLVQTKAAKAKLQKQKAAADQKLSTAEDDNRTLTRTVIQLQKEVKLNQAKIKELTVAYSRNSQLLLSQSKQLEESHEIARQSAEDKARANKYKQLLNESQKLSDQMRKQLVDQQRVIKQLKSERSGLRESDKKLISSILTDEDIQAIYE